MPLRGRARYLAQNSSYAQRFLSLLQKNVVGTHGFKLKIAVPKKKGKGLNDKVNKAIAAAWKRFCRAKFFSADRLMSMPEAMRFAIEQEARDGECIIRLVNPRENKFGFAIQFIDADQLDQTYQEDLLPNGNTIRMGVECDPYALPSPITFGRSIRRIGRARRIRESAFPRTK